LQKFKTHGPSASAWTAKSHRINEWENVMQNLVARFMNDESGATAIEYGLIASLIAVAIIVGAKALGSQINNTFNTVANKMANP
jgi:pilus assembly protein Flp/PilA